MAAAEGPKKTFWKKGDNTKLPGRAQQVHKSQEITSSSRVPSISQSHIHNVHGGGSRPRSKTFEEYEKETDDIWNDGEDINALKFDATELEFVADEGGRGEGEGTIFRKRTSGGSGGKGKGKGYDDVRKRVSGDIKTFFTDVVRASPLTRHSAHHDKARLKVTSLTDIEIGLAEGEFFDPPDRETMRLQKFGKLLAGPNTDLNELRKLSWSGVPPPVRATTWQLLCGYLPANIDRREEILQRKRQEYQNFIQQYYHTRTEQYVDTFRQIAIDVPRMNPDVLLFQQKTVQECFERILFIWSMRHPASGYVQGINDLVTPFFVVFLSYYISGDKNPETYHVSSLSEEVLQMLEADSFWCMQKLLEGIQNNYTLAQPGIQTKIMALKDLIKRLDGDLEEHLSKNSVEFIQFAFRWMNNLLMREFPLHCVIRLWDSYLCEEDGFAKFHIYVCAALLVHFSQQIQAARDFQDIMLFLQNLPTSKWTNDDIELLLAEAYKLKFMFADAPGHLSVQRTS